jgi:hypothetical protein
MAQLTEMAVAPKMFTAPGPHGPTMQFMDQARPTMAQFTELSVAPKMFMAPGPNGPTMQFMDQARATTGELTEGSILITGLQNPAGGAGYTAPQDQARATTAELTELAGPNSIGAAAGTGPGGAMTYLMDAARATLKQFTRDYTGGAGQSQLQAAMNTDAYAAAHLNDKLEQAMNVQRAPQQGSIGDVGSNCDRVGFGDASTVRVKNDNLLMPQAPLADMRGQAMERWIPQVTVNSNLALEEQWVNDRNSPYVLGQLSQNPYAIPMFAQTGNMNLPLQVSAANP